ncbi:hypothetical protein R1sor_005392 [Riccia sorocarpa]|uniref:Uncharacterized protein n=1 Tax=Riccia sorocarpa TaxID=122646 RepID=A0ABD3HLE3_9MARC
MAPLLLSGTLNYRFHNAGQFTSLSQLKPAVQVTTRSYKMGKKRMGQEVETAAKRQEREKKATITWQADEHFWVLQGGELVEPVDVYPEQLRLDFAIYTDAVTAFFANNDDAAVIFDDELSLLGCAAYALAHEGEERAKRFSVYQAIARVFGFRDRTQLDPGLEAAVKKQWSTAGEQFVGFIP